MSFSKSYILERLIEGYVKTPTSLEEQTFDNVALRICHNWKFKQYIFSLKVELPEFLSARQLTQKWEESILKESTEVCKILFLPVTMQQRLISHIRKIAVQLLIWSGMWKALFDISCNLTADLWMPKDWEDGRLNERKIAERILRDKRISNYQRYHLSCFYCLEELVPVLWNKLSSNERNWLVCDGDLKNSYVIRIWSFYMSNLQRFTDKETLYANLFYRALQTGSVVAVIYSWYKLSSITKHNLLADPLSLSHEFILFEDDEFDEIEVPRDENVNRFLTGICTTVASIHRNNILYPCPFMDNFKIQLPLQRDLLDIVCFILSQIRELRITGYEAQFEACQHIIDSFQVWPYKDLHFTELPASRIQPILKQIFKRQFFSLLITYLGEKAVNIFLSKKFQDFVFRVLLKEPYLF